MTHHEPAESLAELPLDFTQYLSTRLHLDTPDALDVLGHFLVNFEPTGAYPRLASASCDSLADAPFNV